VPADAHRYQHPRHGEVQAVVAQREGLEDHERAPRAQKHHDRPVEGLERPAPFLGGLGPQAR
jgi:hypothetical protein